MLWDVFCRVVDNFGDIGVCWRLCADLAERGHDVRLWVDDASALSWMAPVAKRPPGLQLRPWDSPPEEPGDVVIEAFGCNPPDAFVNLMQRPAPPVWINLEYLSAEAWVERCHGLRSPVMSGPGNGLTKWFFYPGFTPRTGGLLREANAMARRTQWQQDQAACRHDWLNRHGVAPLAADERLVSLFCYQLAPVGALLDSLMAGDRPVRVLVMPGFAGLLTRAWQLQNSAAPRHVTLHEMPAFLSQVDFDQLLWCCDLNFVRGEDSAVRALWAGRPHIWQIYPQDDGVHAGKLDAFMDGWMAGWPEDLASDVRRVWRCWNGLDSAPTADFSPLNRLWDDPRWVELSGSSLQRLAEIPDLVTQLCGFVLDKR